MPWFKVDDTLHSHPKARRAGLEAMGLWALAGPWSMAYKTEGFIPRWYVSSWARGVKLAQHLVDAGLWCPDQQDGQDGWRFHDWDDYQPTAEEIERERELGRERQRKFREARRAARNGQDQIDV